MRSSLAPLSRAPRLDRRRLLASALALGALAPDRLWAAAGGALLETLCDLTIPQTDTPGAVAAGVPAFVGLALARGMKGGRPELLVQLEVELDRLAGGKFLALSREGRLAVLAAHDAAILPARPSAPWGVIKSLILRGYYNSEPGASQELRYEIVPGRFDPDLPASKDDRAWSTDAMARMLG